MYDVRLLATPQCSSQTTSVDLLRPGAKPFCVEHGCQETLPVPVSLVLVDPKPLEELFYWDSNTEYRSIVKTTCMKTTGLRL